MRPTLQFSVAAFVVMVSTAAIAQSGAPSGAGAVTDDPRGEFRQSAIGADHWGGQWQS